MIMSDSRIHALSTLLECAPVCGVWVCTYTHISARRCDLQLGLCVMPSDESLPRTKAHCHIGQTPVVTQDKPITQPALLFLTQSISSDSFSEKARDTCACSGPPLNRNRTVLARAMGIANLNHRPQELCPERKNPTPASHLLPSSVVLDDALVQGSPAINHKSVFPPYGVWWGRGA